MIVFATSWTHRVQSASKTVMKGTTSDHNGDSIKPSRFNAITEIDLLTN